MRKNCKNNQTRMAYLFSVVAGGMTLLGKLRESQCPPALQECPKNALDALSPGPEPAKVKRVALT